MVDETKGKKRKGRSTKAAAAAAASKQRTLKDMFGFSSTISKDEPVVSPRTPDTVIELSDSEPEINTIPSSPAETMEVSTTTELESLTTLEGDKGLATMVLEPPSPPRPPRKLFSIFEKKLGRDTKVVETARTNVPTPAITEDLTTNLTPPEPSKMRQTRLQSQAAVAGPSQRTLREGSSREAPIVIESASPAPESPKPAPRPAKPVFSIFNKPLRAARPAVSKLPVVDAAPPNKDNQPAPGWLAFPSATSIFSSREKGKAREVTPLPEHDILRQLRQAMESETSVDLPYDLTIPAQQFTNIQQYINTIPHNHQSIPAISRLLDFSRDLVDDYPLDLASHEQWSHKWHPRQADHVLGNEQHALYLRDWLQALRLQGESFRPTEPAPPRKKNQPKKRKAGKSKKPDIVRHVKKRRRDGLGDDFLAPDDSSDEDIPDAHSSDWDDFEFCREVDARLNGSAPSTDGSRGSSPLTPLEEDIPGISYKPTRFGRQISNTILLAGPSGSGKTAAVYACAEELGWDVFEVYPGIGERSGSELNKLIGDVGKNHTVKVHQSPKKTHVKTAFFQKQAEHVPRRKMNTRRIEDSEDEIDLLRSEPDDAVVDIMREATPEPLVAEPAVNQSVILIEEADVLYQTDTNFWPALVNIIKQCRRPVVLTCNDVSLIPRDDLPLQATLDFQRCPLPTTSSYLQGLCLAERIQVAREDFTHFLQQPSDLRRAVQQLQLCLPGRHSPESSAAAEPLDVSEDVPGSQRGSSPLIHPTDTSSPGPTPSSNERGFQEQERFLRLADRQCEILSFSDSCLNRSSRPALDRFFSDDPLPNVDDELGYPVLYSDVDTDNIPVSPYYAQDQTVVRAIASMLEQHEDAIPLPSSEALESDLRGYRAQVGSIVYGGYLARETLNDAALCLEYAPWARYMAEVDEAQRIALAPEENSQRRRTRNSQRSEPQSWLPLDVATRQALLRTGLRV